MEQRLIMQYIIFLGYLYHCNSEIHCAVLTRNNITQFRQWKEAFENNSLKVNLGTTKVMVNGGTTKDELSKSKSYTFFISSLMPKAN